MATFKFLIRSDKDKPVSIELRFINGCETLISLKTGFVINPKEWDKISRLPASGKKNEELRNNLIKLKEFLFDSFNRAQANGIVTNKKWLQKTVNECFGRNKEVDNVSFLSATCKGEICSVCGRAATNKLGEEIPYDDPFPNRHNLTAYVCREHFLMIVGN